VALFVVVVVIVGDDNDNDGDGSLINKQLLLLPMVDLIYIHQSVQ
jgi:hypothetical protein